MFNNESTFNRSWENETLTIKARHTVTIPFFIKKTLKNHPIYEKVTAFSLIIGLSYPKYYKEWSFALRRTKRLKEEKLIFLYETLKTQANPHLLYNSLNSLPSLVSKDHELSDLFLPKTIFPGFHEFFLVKRLGYFFQNFFRKIGL